MNKLNPWVTGVALALALAVLYTACAGAFALWPQATLEFFNAWFHGLDFRLLLPPGGKPLSLGVFLYGLAGLAATSFAAGTPYAAFANWLKAFAPEPRG